LQNSTQEDAIVGAGYRYGFVTWIDTRGHDHVTQLNQPELWAIGTVGNKIVILFHADPATKRTTARDSQIISNQRWWMFVNGGGIHVAKNNERFKAKSAEKSG
jgi:hypothetical protein